MAIGQLLTGYRITYCHNVVKMFSNVFHSSFYQGSAQPQSPVEQIPIYRPSASAVKLALIACNHPAPLGDLLRCPTSSSALKSLPYLSSVCGTRQLRRHERLPHLPTTAHAYALFYLPPAAQGNAAAATRSARFICHRQRSHRSHTVTIAILQISIYRCE